MASRGSADDYEVNSSVYQMFEDGSVSHYQHISTKSASDVKFFRPRGSGDSYLIFANMKDNTGNTAVPSKVGCVLSCCLMLCAVVLFDVLCCRVVSCCVLSCCFTLCVILVLHFKLHFIVLILYLSYLFLAGLQMV